MMFKKHNSRELEPFTHVSPQSRSRVFQIADFHCHHRLCVAETEQWREAHNVRGMRP